MKTEHGLKGKPSNNKKSEDAKSSSRISIRCHPNMKDQLVEAAKAEGVSLSDYMVNASIEKCTESV